MNPITREESLLDGQDLTPITRKEKFIKRIYDKTQEVPTPVTREEWFLNKAGEGSGGDVTIEQLNVTENGTYSEEGKAYSPVIVEVPAPTLKTKTITENGSYNASEDNADGYSQVTVAVEGFKKKSIANTPTDIASFNDGTANPMPSLEISIEPVQSGSGDPSPSNVRPISGWSGANVTRTGKNLFGGEKLADVIVSKVPYATKDTTNKTVSYSGNRIDNVVLFENFKPNTQYTIIANMNSGVPNLKINYSDGTRTIIQSNNVTVSTVGKTVVSLGGEWRTGDSVLLYEQFGIFEGVITTQDFEPYQGSTTSIPFKDSQGNPVEIYGGSVDVVNGGGQPNTKVKVTLNGSEVWEILNNCFCAYLPNIKQVLTASSSNIVIISESYKAVGVKYRDDVIEGAIAKTAGANSQIAIKDTNYATAADWKAHLENNPITVCYELATPTTFYTQPTAITPLDGDNNLRADCGQILQGEYFVTL